MHLGIVLTRLAEDIDDGADDVLMFGIGPLYDLHDGLIVSLTALQLALGDDDVVDESGVLGDEEGPVLLDAQLTHDGVMGALDNLDDHCLLDVLVATGHIGHLHTVAIHRRHRVALGHEHRGAAIVGQERVAPVGLTTERAFLYLRLLIQAIGIVAHLREEIVPRHLLHRIDGEHLQRMGVELQYLENLLQRERLVGMMLEEVLQQFADLLLSQPFSTFLLSHSFIFFVIFGAKIQKKVKSEQ